MSMEENIKPQEFGRTLITADVSEITPQNVIDVLDKAYLVHLGNRERIRFLIEYEKGNQPIRDRVKKIRDDINIKVCDNLANEITNFRLSYKWGNAITFAQRADVDLNGNDAKEDDKAVTAFNEMLADEGFSSKCVEAFYPMETCGIGYIMVDIKKDYAGGSVFDIIPLNPLNTFVIRDNTVYHRPLMGVVYTVRENGDVVYTCLTKDTRYEVLNLVKVQNGKPTDERTWGFGQRSGEANPMKNVNIVEIQRSYDRMGCFERQISDMDNLNLLVSDFTNNVAQDTQAIWWMNDADFPIDPQTKKVKKPVSGQWVQTTSGADKKPQIQPLVIQTQYDGILANIKYRRDVIRQKANVPVQATAGGGSTGTAMSMASGWESAETSAAMETEVAKIGLMEVCRLCLVAIQESTDTPKDSPLLKLRVSDMKPSILRKKNYDMATKANTYATLVKNGIHPRHAMLFVEAFPDTNLVYTDSKPYLDKYFEKMWTIGNGGGSTDVESDHEIVQDESMQSTNSPLIGGMDTSTGGRHGAGVTK